MLEREGVIQLIYSSRCHLILELFGVITSPKIPTGTSARSRQAIFHVKAVVKDTMCAAGLYFFLGVLRCY